MLKKLGFTNHIQRVLFILSSVSAYLKILILSGKNSGSKSSLSADSIDSRASPQLEHHRRSKSILKKSESSGYRSTDPESERLISDNTSGVDVGSGSEYSPNKRLSSPPARHKPLTHRSLTRSVPLNYQHQDLDKAKSMKAPLFLFDDIINKDRREGASGMGSNKFNSDSGDVALYICPPPPPMDSSPTEETRLLLHTTLGVTGGMQPGNSIAKGANSSSS